jgi:hypothetical protein
VNGDNIVEVLIVSDKYGCLKMKDQVEKIMISSELTNGNVSGLLVISDRHNANKLKQMCYEYIRQHYSQAIQTSQYREIRSEVENILNNTNNYNQNANVNTMDIYWKHITERKSIVISILIFTLSVGFFLIFRKTNQSNRFDLHLYCDICGTRRNVLKRTSFICSISLFGRIVKNVIL